jgi:hypothetical protein
LQILGTGQHIETGDHPLPLGKKVSGCRVFHLMRVKCRSAHGTCREARLAIAQPDRPAQRLSTLKVASDEEFFD